MQLPLLERMQQSDLGWFPSAPEGKSTGSFCGVASAAQPLRMPAPGEQYRFHFDMSKCIGCKCCVVACNEQNGNPADILWRRVGEIEGGTYPATHRHYLSMGCNHCLEPTCMTGCPVNAYTKDGPTGIVRHNADACIGCQYCTWNCSYGVPQYNPERGVVGKCDMCYGRLTDGQSPACVSACPEDAIQIELVSVAQWQQQYKSQANSPGMPSADDSISTTRITRPASAPSDLRNVNLGHLHAEAAHWPLIAMTVLTQLSVGAFTAIWALQATGAGTLRPAAALVALLVAFAALSASTLHLGRPIHAARALKMWRRSWLSREVLLFTLFAVAATVYSIALFMEFPLALPAGALTVLLGVAGVGASARLYLAPGRPAWNSPVTFLEFFATTALLGMASANVLTGGASVCRTGILVTLAGTVLVLALKLARLALSGCYELYSSWQLLSTVLLNKLMLRAGLLIAACLTAFGHTSWARICGVLLIIAGEFLGRYLFFVSVVPTNMATGYLAQEAA